MSAKKVLFLINTLSTGGTERNVSMFCRNIDRARYLPEVWVLHGGGEHEAEIVNSGIKVVNLNRRWSRDPVFALKLARRIARSQFDIIHAFLPAITTYAVLGKMLFGFGKPLLMSIGTTKFASKVEESMFRKFYSQSIDHVFVNSTSVGNYARELGFATENITLLPNGHDFAPFEKPIHKAAIRTALGIRQSEMMLMFVGRFIETKRICDLIDAVKLLIPNHNNLRIVLVGSGPLQQNIERQINDLGLQDNFLLTGTRRDVPDLLRCADMFVFPSEVEGLPNSIIEAGLAQLPIVTCDVPGINDVVQHHETALLVPPRNPAMFADAIKQLLVSPDLANQLGQAAREQMTKTYSSSLIIGRLQELYDQFLQQA